MELACYLILRFDKATSTIVCQFDLRSFELVYLKVFVGCFLMSITQETKTHQPHVKDEKKSMKLSINKMLLSESWLSG